jgi:hypothetical protein
MNATELHAKAARRLSTMNVADLLEQWDEIEKHPMAPEIACVRGWIMDALEIRSSAAFEAWIDGCPHKGPRDYFQA